MANTVRLPSGKYITYPRKKSRKELEWEKELDFRSRCRDLARSRKYNDTLWVLAIACSQEGEWFAINWNRLQEILFHKALEGPHEK